MRFEFSVPCRAPSRHLRFQRLALRAVVLHEPIERRRRDVNLVQALQLGALQRHRLADHRKALYLGDQVVRHLG